MSEATILSPNLSSTTPPPNPTPIKPRPRVPIIRGYVRPPPKPRLSDVPRDFAVSLRDDSSSIKYYAFLASRLAQAGRLAEFLMVVESVLSGGAHPKFVANINIRMVSEGIGVVLKKSGLDTVLEFVKDVERVGIKASRLFDEMSRKLLGIECRKFVVQGRLEDLAVVVETLLGYEFPIQSIIDPTDILKKCVQKQDPQLAKRFASLYPQSQFLFCSLIEEFGKKNDLRSAVEIFEALKEQPGGINKFACRCILDVCGQCGDFMLSRIIFEGLIEEGVVLNVYVLNSFMNVNAHDLSYTLGVYRRMQSLGVEADITTYNILLKACCNTRRADLALKIYEELKVTYGRGTLKLDSYTYSSMIKVLSGEGMWETVLTIKEDMISVGVHPNLIQWSSIMNACANRGLPDHALKLLAEMIRDNCQPNSHCCNVILHACVKSLQFDRAFQLFHFWRVSGIRLPPELESEAVSKIEFKTNPFKPTVYTYNNLMRACGTDYHRARSLMRDMRGFGISPDLISWSILIDICGKAQNVKGVRLALEEMRESGIKLDVQAYTIAIKAYVESKKVNLALELFHEMKREGVAPNRATYNTLLRPRTKYGSLLEVQQSLAIYLEMRKAGYSAANHYLKDLLEEWCEGVLCSQNRDDSSAIRLKTKTTNQKAYYLENVAKQLQKHIEHERVVDVRGLSEVEARIIVLSVLRVIKENYLSGKDIQENMVIITGSDASIPADSYSLDVQHAIMCLLKDQLGLTVIAGHGHKPNNVPHGSLLSPVSNAEGGSMHSARRPQNLGVLTVPVESLHQWLHRKAPNTVTYENYMQELKKAL